MAKRKLEEINAGSMADIAFLLLIFFLVTTTMDVDAGIGRQLPLKIDRPIVDQPPVNKRNVLEILANSNDQLLVEGEEMALENLYDKVMEFYTVNKTAIDVDVNMPNYTAVTVPICMEEIGKLKAREAEDPENVLVKSELGKWETKLTLCQSLPSKRYQDMHKSAVIQLKNQAGTSYGLYIEVQNILKKVVNELRVAACKDMGFPDYFKLDEKNEDDQAIIKKLRILVPERIIESKIDR